MADTDDNGCGAIRFDRMSWESVKPGFQLKTAEAGGKILRMGSYGAGYVGEFWCEDGHIGFVYEGRLTIRFDNDEQHYKAGDAFCIPAGKATRHRISQPLGQAAVVFITSAA